MNQYSEALRMMKVQGAPVDTQSPQERARLIERINLVAREERARVEERWRWVQWGSAALVLMACSFSISFFLERQSQQSVVSSRQSEAGLPTENSSSLAATKPKAGHRVASTPQADSVASSTIPEAGLASGAKLQAAAGAQYRVSSEEHAQGRRETISLSAGRIELAVPALGKEVLAVETHDTRVVVHGTRFSVSLEEREGGEPRTHVEVSEGLVAVHFRGTVEFLRPGATWSSEAQPSATQPVGSRSESHAAARPSAPAPARKVRVSQEKESSSGAGTLGVENALYATAMEHKLSGDYSEALKALDTLLSNYPGSPLAPSAEKAREKIRLLAAVEVRK